MLLPEAKTVVDERLAAGDLVAVVTATNSFITRPIAGLYGISHLVATEPETIDGRFTGRTTGEPCFRAGKLSRGQGLAGRDGPQPGRLRPNRGSTATRTTILPLLSSVTHPVAVDPDPLLHEHASAQGWPVMTWRRGAK